MKVAIFARYSSRLQDEMSLDAQVVEMERYCENQGWDITHRYLLPETRSMDIERAEQFQAMVSAAKKKAFGVLLIHKLDRFGRSRETSVTYKAMLRRAGVRVVSVVENLGDSIYDRMIEGVLEVVAEFYSLNLGEETRKGQRQTVRRGLFKGGHMPFGLTGVVRETGERRQTGFQVHPEEGPLLREAFRLAGVGKRPCEVLDWIESQTGERWAYNTLRDRLENPGMCISPDRTGPAGGLILGQFLAHEPEWISPRGAGFRGPKHTGAIKSDRANFFEFGGMVSVRRVIGDAGRR